MLWQIAGYAVLGLLVAVAAVRFLAARLPAVSLVLPTGVVAGLTGGLVTYSVFDGSHPEAGLMAAVATAAAGLSVLARPARHGRHAKLPAA